MSYATLDEFRRYLGITDASLDDLLLQSVLDGATSAIDGYCFGDPGMSFAPDAVATARTFLTCDAYVCEVDPISDTATAVVKTDGGQDGTYETTLTVTTQFIWEPLNTSTPTRIRLVAGQMFPVAIYSRPQVQVTAKWGWASTPAPIHMACLQVAGEMWKRKDAPFGILEGAEFGPIRMSADVLRSVQALLATYRRSFYGL